MWFNLAAAQGYAAAHDNRDRLAAMMAPAQIAEAQRLAREWKPKSNQNMELKPEAHAICHVSENQREAGFIRQHVDQAAADDNRVAG